MIWCVEDDASIRDIEVYALRSTGFEACGFADGAAFWQALQTEEQPELVVLDVMLPGVDGMELLRRMRASATLRRIPVVMATAKGAEYDKIQGLDLGADYYLAKPFGVMELVSCVKAVLRRCRTEQEPVLRAGGIVLHSEERIVTVEGQRVTCCGCFCPIRAWPSHGTSCSTRSGAWITAARPGRWICTSAPCARSWAAAAA